MKTTVTVLALALAAAIPAQAQLFRPETVNGAVLGGIAGAIVGNNSGDLRHNSWRGAAIGATAGALIGSASARAHDRYEHRGTQVPVAVYPRGYYTDRSIGYGYYSSGYGGYGSYYDTTPSYGYTTSAYGDSRSGDRVLGSTILGGLAGAIIGNNSGRGNGARGAAIGAGAGLLFGVLSERNRAREVEQPVPVYVAPSSTATSATSAPQNVTIINNYYAPTAAPTTPMSSANGLFGR